MSGGGQPHVGGKEGDEAGVAAREGAFAVEVLDGGVVVALDGDDARVELHERDRGLHVALWGVGVADEGRRRVEVQIRDVCALRVAVEVEGSEGAVVVDALGLQELPVAHVAGVELVAAEEGELDVAAVGVRVDELVGLHERGVVTGLPHGVGRRALVGPEVLDEVALDVVVRHEEELGRSRGTRDPARVGSSGDATWKKCCRAGGERAGDEFPSCRMFHCRILSCRGKL